MRVRHDRGVFSSVPDASDGSDVTDTPSGSDVPTAPYEPDETPRISGNRRERAPARDGQSRPSVSLPGVERIRDQHDAEELQGPRHECQWTLILQAEIPLPEEQ